MLQRTFIRHAIASILLDDVTLKEKLGGDIYSHRIEPWMVESLPGMGIYALAEKAIDEDVQPSRSRRQLEIILELICHFEANSDDFMDSVFFVVEQAMDLDAIGRAMEALGGKDTLLAISEPNFELVLAEDDGQITGNGAVSYLIDFWQPADPPQLSIGNFEIGHARIKSEQGHITVRTELPGPFPEVEDLEENYD